MCEEIDSTLRVMKKRSSRNTIIFLPSAPSVRLVTLAAVEIVQWQLRPLDLGRMKYSEDFVGSAVEAALPATAEADDSVVAVAALDSVRPVALDWRAKELTGFVIACLLGLANR